MEMSSTLRIKVEKEIVLDELIDELRRRDTLAARDAIGTIKKLLATNEELARKLEATEKAKAKSDAKPECFGTGVEGDVCRRCSLKEHCDDKNSARTALKELELLRKSNEELVNRLEAAYSEFEEPGCFGKEWDEDSDTCFGCKFKKYCEDKYEKIKLKQKNTGAEGRKRLLDKKK